MGWTFRKSINIGPLRWNLSRRGVGWSVGGKGLRYSQDARGRSYVTVGADGLYYRHPIGGTSAKPSSTAQGSATPSRAPQPIHVATHQAKPAPVHRAPMTAQEVGNLITQAQRPFRWDLAVAGIGALATLVALAHGGFAAGIVVAMICAVVAIAVRLVEQHRRGVVIDCSGQSATERSVAIRIHGTIRCMGTVQGLWATRPMVPGAPASEVDGCTPADVSDTEPPWVVTDIDTPNIICRHWHACFLPHGLLLVIDGLATVTSYRDLHVSGSEVIIDHPSPPLGADIVSPERLRCGQVTLSTPTVAVRLLLSQVDVAKQCVGDLVTAIKDLRAMHS